MELFVEAEVEGIKLSEGEEVGSWLSFSTSSFKLFIYVSCDFLPQCCISGSFVIGFGVFSSLFEVKGIKTEKWVVEL